MTSHAPIPGRPSRPCTAELIAAAELPATTAAAATGPKIPPVAGDGMPGSDPDDLAGITDLLTGGSLPDTVTAALMGGTDPKIPTLVGD